MNGVNQDVAFVCEVSRHFIIQIDCCECEVEAFDATHNMLGPSKHDVEVI